MADPAGENFSLLEDLPDDLVNQVIENLDPFEYLSFRAVSRRHRSIAPKQKCRLLKNYIPSPCLILPAINDHERAMISMVDPRFGRERECYATFPDHEIPEDAVNRYSRDGRLLMTSEKSMFLFRPLTTDKGFLSHKFMRAESLDDAFFLFMSEYDDTVVASFLPMEDWKGLQMPAELIPSFKDVSIHFLMERGVVKVFRMTENGDFFEQVINLPFMDSYKESYLVSCNGEILVVHVGEAGKLIKVFKLGLNEELKDLGNRCLYLSKVSSVSSEIDPGKKNRIYFARFYDNSVVYYSMETCKLHYSLVREGSVVEESLDDFCGTDEQFLHSGCWFEPWLEQPFSAGRRDASLTVVVNKSGLVIT